MTGGFFIGLVGIWQETGHTVRPGLYWGIALVALFIAFYKARAEERDAKEEALRRARGDQHAPSREYWLELYKEKRRIEDELETADSPKPANLSLGPSLSGDLPKYLAKSATTRR